MTEEDLKSTIVKGAVGNMRREPIVYGLIILLLIWIGIDSYLDYRRYETRAAVFRPIIEKCMEWGAENDQSR